MSSLKRNHTYRNGKRFDTSYAIEGNLPTGKFRITLKGVTDKRISKSYQTKANEIEQRAKLFPNDKDWLKEMYITLGQFHKVSEYNLIVPTIKEGFVQFINERKTYGDVKQQTIDCYLSGRNMLIDVLGNIRINQISAMHKPKLEMHYNRKGWSKNTSNQRTRNINQFLKWCLKNEYIQKLPFELIEMKVQKNKKKWIKPSELEVITSAMDNVYKAYVMVAYHSGLRLRELNTNPNDKVYRGLYHSIERLHHTIEGIKVSVWKVTVVGKMNKEDDIFFTNELKPYYDIMVANRRNPNNVSKAFRNACKLTGLGNHKFHDLRHSFCSNLARTIDNPYVIMKRMRHSSLHTSTIYLQDERLGLEKQLESIDLDQFIA